MKKKVTVFKLSAMLFALSASAVGAAARESPSDRVSIVGFDEVTQSGLVPKEFGWLCASLAT